MDDLNEIEKGQICRSAYGSLRETTVGLSNFPGLLKKIIKYRAWERRHIVTQDGTPRTGVSGGIVELSSLRELITEKPLRGWGEDPNKIEALIKDDPEALTLYRHEMNGVLAESRRPTKEEQENNLCATKVNAEKIAGTNEYWQARIERDCPEELEAIKNGKKIIEVRRERGWVSKSKRVTLTGEPEIDWKRLVDAFGEEYLGMILKNIQH